MKTFLLFTLSILWLVFSAFAADATPKTITASSSNGSLLWPTNFFSANSNSIWTVLGGGETGVLAIERGGTGTTNAAGLRGVIGLDAGDPGSMGTNWLTLTTAAEGRGVLGLDVAAPGALGTNLLTQATAGGVRGLVGLDAGAPGALGTNLLTQATSGGVRGLVGLDAAAPGSYGTNWLTLSTVGSARTALGMDAGDPAALGTNWLTLAEPLDGRSALGLGEWGTNTDFGLETASTSVRFATAADDTTIVGVRFTGNMNVSLLSMSTVGNGLLLTEADGTTPFVPANISPAGVMNYSTLTGLFVLSTNNYGVLPLLDDDPAEIATADHGRIYSKIGQKSRATLFGQTLSGSTNLAGEVVMVGPDAVATVDTIILGSTNIIEGIAGKQPYDAQLDEWASVSTNSVTALGVGAMTATSVDIGATNVVAAISGKQDADAQLDEWAGQGTNSVSLGAVVIGTTNVVGSIAGKQPQNVVADLTALAAYSGAEDTVFVNDTGGIYTRTTGLAADGAIVVTNTVSDDVFKRQFTGKADLRWWGAKPDDGIDDSAALQTALAAYSHIYVPAGTWTINANVKLNDGNRLEGAGLDQTIFDASACPTNGYYAVFYSTATITYLANAFTADIAKGSTNFTAGTEGVIKPGDLLAIGDWTANSLLPDPIYSYVYKTWMGYVYATNGPTITMVSASRHSFTNGLPDNHVLIMDVPTIHISDFTLNASYESYKAINLSPVKQSRVERISVTGGARTCVDVGGYEIDIRGCSFAHYPTRDYSETTDHRVSLALCVGGERVLVEGNRIMGDNQLFTTGTGNPPVSKYHTLNTRDLRVVNNYFESIGHSEVDSPLSAVGVHPEADNYEIADNTVIGGFVDIRGSEPWVHDNTVVNGKYSRFLSVTVTVDGNVRVRNNTFRDISASPYSYTTIRKLIDVVHDNNSTGPAIVEVSDNHFSLENFANATAIWIVHLSAQTNTYNQNRRLILNVDRNTIVTKTAPTNNIALVAYWCASEMSHTNLAFNIRGNTFQTSEPGTCPYAFYPWYDGYGEDTWVYGFEALNISDNDFAVARLTIPSRVQNVTIANNRWGYGYYGAITHANKAAYHTSRAIRIEDNLFYQQPSATNMVKGIELLVDSSEVADVEFNRNTVRTVTGTSAFYPVLVGTSGGTQMPKHVTMRDNEFYYESGSHLYAARLYGGLDLSQSGNRDGIGTKVAPLYGLAGTDIIKNTILEHGIAKKNVIAVQSESPTSGGWVSGDIVLNSAPTQTSPRGWVCTTAGTPGAWGLLAPYTLRNTTSRSSFVGERLTSVISGCESGWTLSAAGDFTLGGTSYAYTNDLPASIETVTMHAAGGLRYESVYDVTVTLAGACLLADSYVELSLGGNVIGQIANGESSFSATARCGSVSTNFMITMCTTNGGHTRIEFDTVSVVPWASGDLMHSHTYPAASLVWSASAAPYFEFSASGSNAGTAAVKTNIIALSTNLVTAVPEIIAQIVTPNNGGKWVMRGKIFATGTDDYAIEATYIDPNTTTNVVKASTDLDRWFWSANGYIYFGARDDSADAGVTINTSSVEFKP